LEANLFEDVFQSDWDTLAEEVRAEFKRIAVKGRDEEVQSVVESITPQWVLLPARTARG
jgi:hypothetical protein